jgi:4-hydroxy-2-oxoheptanedioate aldolase
MTIPSLRDRWDERPVLGAWLFLREPMTAEAAARLGYDYVVVDMQHGIASESESLAMIQAAEAAGAVPVVRVASNDPTSIGRALDAGALAVIVPMVNDPDAAARAVAACRYAPLGSRSYGPVAAISRYSDDYARVANDAICCIVMIETKMAVDNIDAILAVPGIDAVYVGPADLSLTLGLAPETDHDDERFTGAIRTIITACGQRGIVPGIHADAHLARKWREMGFRMITVGYDQFSVLAGLRKDIDAARDDDSEETGDPGSGYA